MELRLGCCESVSRVFQESFNGVSRKLHGCYMKALREIERCFEGVLWCFKEVSRLFQGSFKGVS